MTYAVGLDGARLLLAGLARREKARDGGNRDNVRERLASGMKLAPGTLENLARNRLKRLDDEARRRIALYAIADLGRELTALHSELALARQMGAAEDSEMVQRVLALMADAQALYSEITGVKP